MFYKIVSTMYGDPTTYYGDTDGIETVHVTNSEVGICYKEHGFNCKLDDEGVQSLIDFWENRMLVQADDSVPF